MMDYQAARFPVDLAGMLEREYGLKLVFTRSRAGPRSTVLFLQGQDESYVGKVYVSDHRNRIDETLRLSQRAAECGCPAVVPVCPVGGHDDRRTVSVTTAEGDAWFALFPFVDGELYESGRGDQIRAAGRSLAMLHRSGHEPAPTATGCESFAEFTEEVAVAQDSDLLDPLVDRVDPRHLDSSEAHFCHGDYRAQNMVYRGGRIEGIIDFDDACFTTRLWDLAYAIVFFGAAMVPTPLLPAERSAFVRAYHRVYPLMDEDLERLPSHLCWATARGLSLWLRLSQSAGADVRHRLEAWLGAYAPMINWSSEATPDQLKALL